MSDFDAAVMDAARRHGHNWEAVAFELDSDPDRCEAVWERVTAAITGSNGTTQPVVEDKPLKTCEDHECSHEFTPTSARQKYCKEQDCKRRRWAREARQKTGHKPRTSSSAPMPPKPASARQDPPRDAALAGRYVDRLLELATADLTPAQARAELERLAGLA